MNELEQYISLMINSDVKKIIISKPVSKSEAYKKIIVEKKGSLFQAAKYTEKQVFHENIMQDDLGKKCAELIENHFRQVNGISSTEEHIILISKKGSISYKVRKNEPDMNRDVPIAEGHNRKKNYILEEGMNIEPLVDMGIFTKDGKVVNSMYDKYKQINRFIEILNDEISNMQLKKINVIDFGCGKPYLTFVVYYYLTEVMKIEVNMIGLDLKADVIKKCNAAAQKYNYSNLN